MKVEMLKEYYDTCKTHYAKEHKRIQLLDAADRGDLWKSLGTKFPDYQILPDTNHIAYVKNNMLASIYTVAKSAEVMPTSEQDREITTHLNIALDNIWSLCDIGQYQFLAGERAALTNIGITQIGWDEANTTSTKDGINKGNITVANVDPIKFMRDPFARDLQTAGYCMTYDSYHKSVFLENAAYKEEFLNYTKTKAAGDTLSIPELGGRPTKNARKDYYTLIIFWVKNDDGGINEYHTVNCEHILFEKENIQPNCYPFAILYCNTPVGQLIGTSECAKIYANNLAYNLMDSVALTAEYKNQRPPKFISADSGLNVQAFSKHGDEADKTFVVKGRADQAVHYHQFPQISAQLPYMKQGLQTGMELMSGVDGRYTGRDTGSIITTGGTEEMLNRVTVIDTPRIANYEAYAKQLTKIILANFVQHAPKRKYFYKKPNSTKWDTLSVDFPKIDNETLFNYQINISSELPKNKQRLASMANMLMEKQMQYQESGSSVQLITEEEWLMMQDIPNKEFMLERMGIQRLQDATEEVSQVLFQYADLIQNGMKPDDAILATAGSLKDKRAGMMPEQSPGQVMMDTGLE